MATVKPSEDGECLEWAGNMTGNGYGFFQFNRTATTAHRWVYQYAHNVKLPRNIDVMHACDNRRCVLLAHLSAGTRKQNMEDAVKRGRMDRTHKARGENSGRSVLDEAQVRLIRTRFDGGEKMRVLSDEFQVSFQSISRIVRRLSWSHLQ